MGYKLGAVENRFKFTNVKDGRVVEAISTPSAFMRADAYADAINAAGGHTPEYALTMLGHALAVLTMRHEGLVHFKELDLDAIGDALNEWDYEMVEAGGGDTDAPDPLAEDPGDAQETAEGE